MEETKQDEKQTENEQRYEDEVEINDFPQTARWKVTSKVFYVLVLHILFLVALSLGKFIPVARSSSSY